MKKSKFLKKSLAMLLAVMLVVAMIPLSAAAEAADPTVYVENQLASLSGTTYTVTAPSGVDVKSVDISWVEQEDVELVAVDKDGNEIGLTNIDLTEEATLSGEVYTLGLRTKVDQSEDDATTDKDYTLEITVKAVVESSDATIASLTNASGELDDVTNWTISADTITLYYAFSDEALPTSLSAGIFVTTNDDATPAAVTLTDNKGTLVVTAQNGSTKKYTVEVKMNEGITSFTVPEQTEASKIEGTDITIKVPYKYANGFEDKIVPTFELADGILALTTEVDAYNENVVTSGETELDFTTGEVTLYAWTDKTTSVEVTVTLEAPDQNPEAVLKTVKVGASNEVAVEGTTVTVELPAGFDFADNTMNVQDVLVSASENATVSVSAQGINGTYDEDSEKYTLEDVNVSGKTFVITVKSEDGETTSNYTINLTSAASADASLNDFSVKYVKDGKEGDTYTASNGTLTLPYSAKAEMGNYKVYAQTNSGAVAAYGDSSDEIENGVTTLGTTGLIDAETSKITLTVIAESYSGDVVVRTYTITVKYENAKTARSLTSAEFVGTNEESKITEDNTYAAKKGTAKADIDADDEDETVNTIKVTVPFSFETVNEEQTAYLNALTLSDGATAYDADGEEIYLVGDEDNDASDFVLTGMFDAVDSNGNLDVDKAIAIYVLSEKAVIDAKAAAEEINADFVAANGTVYYVYAVKDDAAEGNSLTSIESTLNENVTAKVSGTTITITVPGSYAEEETEFTLNFKTSKLASLVVDQDADTEGLVSDNGNEDLKDDPETTKFSVDADGNLTAGGTEIANGGKIYVRSESGEFKTYTVKTVVNEKEDGAELTSVSVNGIRASISGKTVTVNLPFGTNLYPVKLGLTASKMATILVNGEEYDENENYDLNEDIKIYVLSEDGTNANTYTLKVTTADQFSDVDTNDWYYNNVMRAVELGILSGYTDGTFKPMNNITRRDFAIMLAQSLGHDNDEKATSPFKDVADTDYGVSSIAYLYENEITVGDSNGNFNPDANITRQEAAIMLVKAFEATGTSSDLYADDAQIASWAKSFVYTAKAAGLMKGDDHNEFNPTDRLTRAEAASAMVNAVDN